MSVIFEDFRNQWIIDIVEGEPSTREKGRRFAFKLLRDWVEINDEADDVTYCDGTGDGGIDVACLRLGEPDTGGDSEGDTWYLIQTKYGTAFQGINTLLTEGRKVIETIDGQRDNLSSL